MSDDAHADLERQLAWFNAFLVAPESPLVGPRAVFWYVSGATPHIRRM